MKVKKGIKITFIIFILCVEVFLAFTVYSYTKKIDLKYFGISFKVNGQEITKELPKTDTLVKVDVDYIFNILNKKQKLDYTVNILPNKDYPFDFFLDKNVYAFTGTEDYNKEFELVKSDKYFTFKNKYMKEILQQFNTTANLTCENEFLDGKKNLFIIQIKTVDELETFNIKFSTLDYYFISSVVLPEGGIIL